MVDWQITATTIYCDAVKDEVTILVSKDWTVKCTGHKKYADPDGKSRKSKRNSACAGEACPRVKAYKQKLVDEEAGKGR